MQSKIERTVQGQLDASSTPCLHESIHKLQRIFFRLTGPLEIKKKSFKHIVLIKCRDTHQKNLLFGVIKKFFYRYLQEYILGIQLTCDQ